MEQIISKIKSFIYNEEHFKEKVYLIEKLSNKTGIFYHDNKVFFAESMYSNSKVTKVETVSLTLITGLQITSLISGQSFEDGIYNVIYYNGNIEDDNFESFIRLSSIYSISNKFNFIDFFNSLINIFQLPNQERLNNAIGLMGELILIREIWKWYKIDITNKWHVDGVNSKYDFQFKKANIEVKSTLLETNSFKIKHGQIFNQDKNYLILIRLDKGKESLKSLIDFFFNTHPFSNDLGFQIKLHDNLVKVDSQQKNKKYELKKIYIYDCDKLDTLENIPESINLIEYEYTFDLTMSEGRNVIEDLLYE